MGDVYIGVDNGVSGSFAAVGGRWPLMFRVPTKTEQDFQKKQKRIKRIDVWQLERVLPTAFALVQDAALKAVLERPFVNPKMFNATLSAIRAWEATLITLERLKIPYQVIDSKEWQKIMLPKGCKGAKALKQASADAGRRLFPALTTIIDAHGDADSLLIAEYARRVQL